MEEKRKPVDLNLLIHRDSLALDVEIHKVSLEAEVEWSEACYNINKCMERNSNEDFPNAVFFGEEAVKHIDNSLKLWNELLKKADRLVEISPVEYREVYEEEAKRFHAIVNSIKAEKELVGALIILSKVAEELTKKAGEPSKEAEENRWLLMLDDGLRKCDLAISMLDEASKKAPKLKSRFEAGKFSVFIIRDRIIEVRDAIIPVNRRIIY